MLSAVHEDISKEPALLSALESVPFLPLLPRRHPPPHCCLSLCLSAGQTSYSPTLAVIHSMTKGSQQD